MEAEAPRRELKPSRLADRREAHSRRTAPDRISRPATFHLRNCKLTMSKRDKRRRITASELRCRENPALPKTDCRERLPATPELLRSDGVGGKKAMVGRILIS